MRYFLAFLFIAGSCCILNAQKSPYHIRNFQSSEYGGFNQTWQCQQDANGLIHVASTSQIYTYDGIRWYPTLVKRGAATRQIHYDSLADVMYVGSVSEFGCLERGSSGLFVYRSFVDQLTPEQAVFSDIWEMYQIDDRIYMQSSERIFVIEGKKVIATIEPYEGKSFALMFGVDNRLYVRQRTVGMMEIKDTSMSLVPNSEMFATERLLGMITYKPDTTLMLTGDHGFVKFGGVESGHTSFSPFPVSNDTFLTTGAVLSCKWISENEFAVSSRIGLMIYTRDFVPKVLFNKKAGLSDESIAQFFVDRENNIWLTHNSGCSMISYDVPAVTYNDGIGFAGSLAMMMFKGDTSYLATSEGVYRSTQPVVHGQPLRFSRLNTARTEVWDMYDAGSSLLLSTSQGVFDYRENNSVPVTKMYTNEVRTTTDGSKIIAAEKGGISVIRHNSSGYYSSMAFEVPGVEFMKLSAIHPVGGDTAHYRFQSLTRFKTVMSVDLNLRDSTIVTREYGPANGLPTLDFYLLEIGDSIYYIGYFSAYRYIPEKDFNDSSLCIIEAPDVYARLKAHPEEVAEAGFNFSLFMEGLNTPLSTFFGNDGNGIYSRPVLLGELILGDNIQFGMVRGDSLLWILKKQEIILYNLKNPPDTNLSYKALVTNVRFTGDSVGLFFPGGGTVVPYSGNSVIFRFAAPYYTYNMKVQFQYKLEGFDETWSRFTEDPEKEYTNLPEGTYTFVVRAENAFHMYSTEGRFTFTILPPWYRTAWAYGLYGIGFVLFILLTIRISARRLRQQKEKLELLVKERTAEVVEQKQLLETQKVDLEVAYTGIQDSIHYSQRIQQAILPTPEEIKRIVPDSFVLFCPRDIVSGDFYWFAEKAGKKYIACVDCTGHGVPGALMSMIGNTLLNQIILEKNISGPDEILNKLHEGVRHALKQDSGGDTRDGMDLALVVLDEKKSQVQYAGANRAMWIARQNELIEIKADKFPIAGSQQEEVRRFNAHTIHLQKGDVIYLATDGYADQFGGSKGKKFMVKQFTRMLVEIHTLPMIEQRTILEHKFNEWRGKHDQVDDVLVIGIRT